MIAFASLDLCPLGIARGARLKGIRDLFKRSQQTPPDLPSQRAALPSLVLGQLAGYLVEFGASIEFRDGFFLFRVLLALCRLLLAASPELAVCCCRAQTIWG